MNKRLLVLFSVPFLLLGFGCQSGPAYYQVTPKTSKQERATVGTSREIILYWLNQPDVMKKLTDTKGKPYYKTLFRGEIHVPPGTYSAVVTYSYGNMSSKNSLDTKFTVKGGQYVHLCAKTSGYRWKPVACVRDKALWKTVLGSRICPADC